MSFIEKLSVWFRKCIETTEDILLSVPNVDDSIFNVVVDVDRIKFLFFR
jgi:hypothetical protein